MGPRNTILVGDAVVRLRELDPALVDCVITSPPYFQLRDYGVSGQIGLEDTVEAWVEAMREVMAEIARTLKPTGSAWINLGDSFSRHTDYGAPPKSMLLAPERFLLAMLDDGWIVRGKVIWAKTNPMPHSVADRLNTTYDVVYHLVRSRRYFFDLDRIREPHTSTGERGSGTHPGPSHPPAWAGPLASGTNNGLRRARPPAVPGHWLGKNPGDVWRLPASNFPGAHFATFPEALVERPLLATCPEAICTACEQPWRRKVTVRRLGLGQTRGPGRARTIAADGRVRRYSMSWRTIRRIGELQPCDCGAPTIPGLVLDPFFGAGTVGVLAERLGRDWLGIELNPAYAALANNRLGASRSEAPPALP